MKSLQPQNILLYDGICVLCNRAVQFLIKADKKDILQFAPLQGDFAKTVDLPSVDNPEMLQTVVYLSRHKTEKERIYVCSDAVLNCLFDLGGLWKSVVIFKIVPRCLRDFMYHFIAMRRYSWFGKYDSCILPEVDFQDKFLT